MTVTQWIALATPVIAFLGLGGVLVQLFQKRRADNRAEWWRRYTWAVKRGDSPDERIAEQAYQHVAILAESPLATPTEARVIQMIGLYDLARHLDAPTGDVDNEGTTTEETACDDHH